FPVGAFVFSRVTFAGLALNFLAIPLMAVAQIAGMAVVPLMLVSRTLAVMAGGLAHLGAAGLIWSAELLRFAPALSYRIAPAPPALIVLYYAAGVLAWRFRSRLLGAAAVCAALWILIDPRVFVERLGDGQLHLTFIDVGQGDAIFVR